jgi:hypothetical protein
MLARHGEVTVFENRVKVTKAQVRPIVDEAFPNYSGRKFTIEFTAQVTFYDTNWSGGTRNKYVAVRADGGHLISKGYSAPAPWANPVEGRTIDLPVDVLIVKHSMFCGTDVGITIYAHPSLAPRWLPAKSEL